LNTYAVGLSNTEGKMRILAALLLVVSGAWAGPEVSAVKVCRIKYAENDKGTTIVRSGLGSGVVVATGKDCSYILTNSHVAPNDAIYHIIYKGELYPCEWIGAVPEKETNDKGDLGLIKCFYVLPKVEIANSEPTKGTLVYQFGFPGGGRLSKLSGKFLGRDGGPGNIGDYLVVPGSSGSGVYYNDKLIGLSYMITNMKDNYGNTILDKNGDPIPVPPCYMVTLQNIKNFLRDHIPVEMGYYEKAPMPRVVPTGSTTKSCR
jgi:hypothetical protein